MKFTTARRQPSPEFVLWVGRRAGRDRYDPQNGIGRVIRPCQNGPATPYRRGTRRLTTTTTPSVARRSRTIGFAVGIVLVVLGGIALLNALGLGSQEQSTTSFEGVTVLEFDLDNAAITIAAAGDSVVVEKDVRTGLWGGSATEEHNGDVLRVRLDCPNLFGFGCRGTYEITVPADVVVNGDTANGAIELRGLEAESDVRTSNGAIRLEDLEGPTTVRTSNGEIDGSDLASPSITANTSNGPIRLGFRTAPDRIEARTSNGRVEIFVPDDSPAYAIDADTSNGTVESALRTDPAASARIDVSTSNGDVVIGYR